VIGFIERLTPLFDNADLPITNDTRMTAPLSPKAELPNLKFLKQSLHAASAWDHWLFASWPAKHSEKCRGLGEAYGFAGWMKVHGLTSESFGTSIAMR
jgi:hypothetical protein